VNDEKVYIIYLQAKTEFLYALRLMDQHKIKPQEENYTSGRLFFTSAETRDQAWALFKPHLTLAGWTDTQEAQ